MRVSFLKCAQLHDLIIVFPSQQPLNGRVDCTGGSFTGGQNDVKAATGAIECIKAANMEDEGLVLCGSSVGD